MVFYTIVKFFLSKVQSHLILAGSSVCCFLLRLRLNDVTFLVDFLKAFFSQHNLVLFVNLCSICRAYNLLIYNLL